jgi:haloacetate dehalogenase
MLDRFDEFDVATTGTTIHGRRGGLGPPVLLLHGIPETHLMWRQVAPQLTGQFWYRPLDIWKAWAAEVHGGPVTAGHFIPEEAPGLTARHLTEFLA